MFYNAETAFLLPQASTLYITHGLQELRNKNRQAPGSWRAKFKSHSKIKTTNRAEIANLFLNIEEKSLGAWGHSHPAHLSSPSWLRLWQALLSPRRPLFSLLAVQIPLYLEGNQLSPLLCHFTPGLCHHHLRPGPVTIRAGSVTLLVSTGLLTVWKEASLRKAPMKFEAWPTVHCFSLLEATSTCSLVVSSGLLRDAPASAAEEGP